MESAVLKPLTLSGQQTYDRNQNEFVDWYWSELRLANRTDTESTFAEIVRTVNNQRVLR
jgi:hypothetical protein